MNNEKDVKSVTVFFTGDDLNNATHFMRQVDKVREMCQEIKPQEYHQGVELENERRFVGEIPRQMLRIAYDTVMKEIFHKPKKVVSKTSFRGNLYEIIVLFK